MYNQLQHQLFSCFWTDSNLVKKQLSGISRDSNGHLKRADTGIWERSTKMNNSLCHHLIFTTISGISRYKEDLFISCEENRKNQFKFNPRGQCQKVQDLTGAKIKFGKFTDPNSLITTCG